jgi:hypothetical protein
MGGTLTGAYTVHGKGVQDAPFAPGGPPTHEIVPKLTFVWAPV